MPVTGSSLVLRCAIVQDGVMRRSEDEVAVDVMRMGMSRAVVMDGGMVASFFLSSFLPFFSFLAYRI